MVKSARATLSMTQPIDETEHELDLALAAELQAALLPATYPPAWTNHRAAALHRMCGSVGGDFHEIVRLNDDQTAMVIGDVVGHGVTASLVMAIIMGFLRSSALLAWPARLVRALNEVLLELGDRTGSVVPCSVVYGVIDAPSGVGFFVNAGHPVPFLCNGRSCAPLRLGRRNLLLGVQPYEPEEGCHTFTPGERLVLYTDGVADAMNLADERFDTPRLQHVLEAHLRAGPEACARAVFDAVEDFRNGARQTDDETVLVVDRT